MHGTSFKPIMEDLGYFISFALIWGLQVRKKKKLVNELILVWRRIFMMTKGHSPIMTTSITKKKQTATNFERTNRLQLKELKIVIITL